MERPGDDAATWNLKIEDREDGLIEVSVRDEVVIAGNDVPVHVGLVLVVERFADSLEKAIEKAENDAAIALALLSAASRAPTSSRRLLLAYEITSGAAERRIRQWFWDTPIVVGKTPVPQTVFGDLFQGFTSLPDAKLTWRLSQSLSWHQRALAEYDAVARFMGLWIACEALEPRLREHFGVSEQPNQPANGLLPRLLSRLVRLGAPRRVAFPGLKALAESERLGDTVVKEAYTLRNDLFHARRVEAPKLITRARRTIPELERLLPSGWARLLGLSERTRDFPEASVVPHEVGMFFDAVLLNQDEKQWDRFRHPHFAGNIEIRRRHTDDQRDVSAEYPTNLQVRNVAESDEAWRGLGVGIVGPSGPHIGTGGLAGPPEINRGGADTE